MLRFNSYRSQRYLRSRFVEGKYLLASESSDLELEIIEQLRNQMKAQFGDVAIADAWKVERLNQTQILIQPGDAWVKGLPFSFRSGKDQLVTGAILTVGIVPVGITVTDDSTGLGKIITFNDAATTPTNTYKVVVTAKEQLITEVEDPFLKNANITESTAQKVRLVYQLNLVPLSLQTESPIPYRDESSTAGSATNFPNTGGLASPNLVNQIEVTPTAAGNGELLSVTAITGSEGIDGRDLEITLRNDPGIGGGNPLPNNPTAQLAFANGKLIDSNGNKYHINAIFNDVISTQVVIRIDKEPSQPNPEIINTKPFMLVKRDVYVTDDVNGSPQGKLYWGIAEVGFDNSAGQISHSSKIIDLRKVMHQLPELEDTLGKKMELLPTGGGNVSFNVTGADLLTWSANVDVLNAFGPTNTVPASTVAMVDEGSIVYDLDLVTGGNIDRGNLSVTILTAGLTTTLSNVDDLTDVRIGNIIRIGSTSSIITAINNYTNQISVTPATPTTGVATIYLDSFGPEYAPYDLNSYVFAVRKGTTVELAGGSLGLESGETSEIGDGVTKNLLTFLGAVDENDADPNYSSTSTITQGTSLVTAISDLDNELNNINISLATPLYDERILYPSGLAASTSITIPNNSRNGNLAQTYIVGSGRLQVFLNQQLKYVGIDYTETSTSTIEFAYALNNDSEVHFRDAVLGGGSGGGGSGSLQDAYDNGRTVNVSTGFPLEISGASGKLLKVNGDMDVSGVIDPKGITFDPQATNPLSSGKGIWVNSANEMIYENGTFGKNITTSITNLESGSGIVALTRNYTNSTGSTIAKGAPVYTPSAGNVAPANGNFAASSRVIGVAAESIAPAASGKIALYGAVDGLSGYTHGAYIYLGNTAGSLTDVEPTLGPYSSGFNVILLGVMENANLILHIQNVGVL